VDPADRRFCRTDPPGAGVEERPLFCRTTEAEPAGLEAAAAAAAGGEFCRTVLSWFAPPTSAAAGAMCGLYLDSSLWSIIPRHHSMPPSSVSCSHASHL
jgi:hypothetical protein